MHTKLLQKIDKWSKENGFQQFGITNINLTEDDKHLKNWLSKNYHGSMHFMEKHGDKRTHPEQLMPGTIRVLSFRMDYYPEFARPAKQLIQEKHKAYISRYALGRDYHKKIRKALAKISQNIQDYLTTTNSQFRVFTDSAPIMERALARNAGLGWIAKNTCLINPKAGSWFFLAEIFTDLPLPINDAFDEFHCGSCTACIDVCPTQAIIKDNVLDARRCISYLTIENQGAIPVEFRQAIGNRIYGCDDCQLVCPWNRFSQYSKEEDFSPRFNLDNIELTQLFLWTENQFNKNLQGSAIRRIGYQNFLRNIAVALGNSSKTCDALTALNNKKQFENLSPMVLEHIDWAINNLQAN